MEPSEARLGEPPRLRRRILTEYSGGLHVSANEANAGTILEVDRREQDHGGVRSSSRSL